MIGVLISSLLKCGYATIWHGLIMGDAIGNQANNDEAVALRQDFRSAGLEPDDEALLEYCERVTSWPHTATQTDVDNLRAHAFTDTQVLEIAVLIGFWNWVPRVLLALGVAEDDYTKKHGHPETREALAKGLSCIEDEALLLHQHEHELQGRTHRDRCGEREPAHSGWLLRGGPAPAASDNPYAGQDNGHGRPLEGGGIDSEK